MPKITNFDTLPVFGAAAGHGPAIAATFPYTRPSLPQLTVPRFARRLFARWKAARARRRTINALSALSDSQLRDIGLTRGNIICTANEAAEKSNRTRMFNR